jgi:rRNA maturation endonuclease Nob1
MPLVACPDCGKEFSDQAKECPTCGHPSPVVAKERKVEEVIGLVTALAIIFFLVYKYLL